MPAEQYVLDGNDAAAAYNATFTEPQTRVAVDGNIGTNTYVLSATGPYTLINNLWPASTAAVTLGAMVVHTNNPEGTTFTLTDSYGEKVPEAVISTTQRTYHLAVGDSYSWTASAEGYYPQTGSFTYTGVGDLDVNLVRITATVVVTVRDSNGQPVSGAPISLLNPDGTAFSTLNADDSGVCYFLDVPVLYNGDNYRVSFAGNGMYLASNSLLYVTKAGTVNTTITLRKVTGDILIHVVDAANNTTPLANAYVWVDGRLVGITDVNGQCTASDLEAGREYPVVASLDGYTFAASNSPVSIANTCTISLREIPVADNTIRIRVVNGGLGIGGATVNLTGPNGYNETAATDPNGYATFKAVDGTYSYTASKNGYTGTTIAQVAAANGQTYERTVTLTQQTYNVNFNFYAETTTGYTAVSSANVLLVGSTPGTYGSGVDAGVSNGYYRYEFVCNAAGYVGRVAVVYVTVNGSAETVNCYFVA